MIRVNINIHALGAGLVVIIIIITIMIIIINVMYIAPFKVPKDTLQRATNKTKNKCQSAWREQQHGSQHHRE